MKLKRGNPRSFSRGSFSMMICGLGVLVPFQSTGCGPGTKSKPAARPAPRPEDKPYVPPGRAGGTAPAPEGEHLRRGKAALKQRLFSAALRHFDKAVAAHPNDGRAHYYRGVCLQRLGKRALAVAAYRKAVGLKPKFPEKYLNLAGLLLLSKKLAEGEKVLEQAVRFFPKDASLWHNLGLARLWARKLLKAAYAFEKGGALSPGDADYPIAAGLCYLKANRPQTALARFQAALKISSAKADAHEGAAQALRLLKRHAEGLKHARKAVSLKPRKPALRHLVGVLLLDMGKPVEAAAAFRNALQRAPKSAVVHMRLGQALTLSQKARKALPFLRKAAALAGAKKARLRASIHFFTAEALRVAKRCRKAVPLYRKALKTPAIGPKRKADIVKGLKRCGKRP